MNNLKAEIKATAEAYENILRNTMPYNSRVQARRIYMEKLDDYAFRANNAEAVELIESAKGDISSSESPRLLSLASELV